MTRPKYLQNADLVQDAIQELGWATLNQLATETGLTYGQVHQASQYLRRKMYVNHDIIEGKLVLFPFTGSQ